ncbi:indole-3-glycerol phosphate synthase TrpC [Acetobacter sp. AN02]|uniref:indole-3-glycerol phosphate synthase TrpC n=1 Tax=Acetobacter sp. AN02 TaxID=2894186 RepID=UPI0024343376|nr:indole-3-glycerol phosphate synthase TrpC [Acetobacter sp. AN02]MDG6093691.1 indole-3-glycerol phosphate synthase TrpC [Acetobacter sp. AN02]
MTDTPTEESDTGTEAGSCPDSGTPCTPDILQRIVARSRLEVEHRSTLMPLKEISARAQEVEFTPRGFGRALKEKTAEHSIGLIAEVKKASPSAGLLRDPYDPVGIAQSYEKAGACCLSVLTEGSCFRGSLEDLKAIREATTLPVLRKDFLFDPWQVYESRLWGADCILLIMSILEDELASELVDHARGLDMDILVEVHSEEELSRALALNASLMGINNRDLKTLQTDLQTTISLAPLVPPDKMIVSESGIKTPQDVARLQQAGASGFLVGESMLREENPGEAARRLLAG